MFLLIAVEQMIPNRFQLKVEATLNFSALAVNSAVSPGHRSTLRLSKSTSVTQFPFSLKVAGRPLKPAIVLSHRLRNWISIGNHQSKPTFRPAAHLEIFVA